MAIRPYQLADRDTLIQIAAALYEKNEAKASQITQKLEPTVASEININLYTMANPIPGPKNNTDLDYWKHAFLTPGEAPLLQKIKAVEEILQSVIPATKEISGGYRSFPEVAVKEWFDLGFDPSYSIDGEYYTTAKSSLTKTISGIFAYVFFRLNTWLTWNGTKRNVSQLIVKCASQESTLAKVCYQAFMKSKWDVLLSKIPAAEQNFFDTSSDLAKAFPADGEALPHPKRYFPSELLQPIHSINRPAVPHHRIYNPVPSQANPSLTQLHDWTFARLNYTLYGSPQDRLEYDFVPHYLFIFATQKAAEDLKQASQVYRKALAETVTDWKCAFSYAACMTKLKPALEQLKTAWRGYVESHELLTEANQIVQLRDHPHLPSLETNIAYDLYPDFEAEKQNFQDLKLKTVQLLTSR